MREQGDYLSHGEFNRVNKNDKDGIQEEDSHKEVTQRNVKHEKSMIKDKKAPSSSLETGSAMMTLNMKCK